MKLVTTKCAICGSSEDYVIIYEKNFEEADLNANVFSARKMPDNIHYQIVKCKKDGLIRSNPVLQENVLSGLYSKSKFTYEGEVENLADSYYNALKFILSKLPKTAMILEIGCGNGFLLKKLYDMGYKNVFGVEPSIDAAQKADNNIRQRIVVDMLRPGIFKVHTFNVICFFQTFDHVQKPNDFLKICYDLLLEGGKILVFNHDVESLQAKMLKEKSPIIDIGHAYLYSKTTLRKVFEKNFFQPLKIYSSVNVVSLKHLIWLMPIPHAIKVKLLNIKTGIIYLFLKQKIKIKLGNICLIARKV